MKYRMHGKGNLVRHHIENTVAPDWFHARMQMYELTLFIEESRRFIRAYAVEIIRWYRAVYS